MGRLLRVEEDIDVRGVTNSVTLTALRDVVLLDGFFP